MNKPKLNILIAIPYLTDSCINLIKENQNDIRFLLDSGAFTAWKKGSEYSLDFYLKYLSNLQIKPWRYFTLDKIGDPAGTRQNYDEILKAGFNPIPVFTRGDKLEELEYYYSKSDVVAVGGLVGTQENKGFLKGIMKQIGNRKTHWLGFVRHNFVNHFKPYMCDASSWSHASRNGDLKAYLGKGVIKSFRAKDFLKKPDASTQKLFESYDIKINDLSQKSFWKSWRHLNSLAARMWVRRSIETEINIKTKLFLACASEVDLKMILDGYNKEFYKYSVGSFNPDNLNASFLSKQVPQTPQCVSSPL